MIPPYVGAKLETRFREEVRGQTLRQEHPRGVPADEYVMENNALSAASLGLPYVRGAPGFGAGTSVGTDSVTDDTELVL